MNKQVALVLAGGGSLGAYQVGALKALKELGYHFDIVTGTSIGALNGSFVHLGCEDHLEELWNNITPEKVMKNGTNVSKNYIFTNKTTVLGEYAKWLKIYLSGGKMGSDISPFKEYVRNAVDFSLRKTATGKFSVMCSYFPSLKRATIDMTKVSDEHFLGYLHASSACFPIFPVETVDGKKYVDGFYNDNLPIKLAFDLGATDVIAIDMRLFALEPVGKFYVGLPNVEYIAPFKPLGSMVDFGHEIIAKNMELGYWDTLKHFGKMGGFASTIEGEIPEVSVISFIVSHDSQTSRKAITYLQKGIDRPLTEKEFFIRILEILAEKMKIPMTYQKYTFDQFFNLVREEALKRSDLLSKSRFAGLLSLVKATQPLDDFLIDFVQTFFVKGEPYLKK